MRRPGEERTGGGEEGSIRREEGAEILFLEFDYIQSFFVCPAASVKDRVLVFSIDRYPVVDRNSDNSSFACEDIWLV